MFRALVLLMLLTTLHTAAQSNLTNYRQDVLSHSWQLRAARARTQEAAEGQMLAQTDFLPRLSLAGDFSYSLRNQSGVKPWSFSVQPEIIATLYNGGAVRATYKAANLNYSIRCEEELVSELSIRYAADYAYWNLSAMKAFRDAMKEYVEIIRSLKRVIDERFNEGYIAKGDLLMIEARLSTAEYELLVAEQNFEEALHNFNILRGSPSDQEVQLDDSILDQQPLPQRVGLEESLEARPDFQAARLRSELARNAIRLTRASYNPQLSIGIRGGWRPNSPNLRGETHLDGALFARLSVPIFQWGARRHATRATRAAALEAEWVEADLREEILREERNGWSAVVESSAQVATMGESLRIAGENLDLGTYAYSEGLTTILDVLQAQLNWIQIYTNAITAHFNYAVACSAYQRITGQMNL